MGWRKGEIAQKACPLEKRLHFQGGRVTLIKSTLSSMPIYLMSLVRMPKAIANRLEKIPRDFLWGGEALDKRPHLVNWQVVCSDKGQGGIGVKNLTLLNRVLLGKWVWTFAWDIDSIWKQVISSKFGYEVYVWRSKEAQGSFGVGFWKTILKEAGWVSGNWKFRICRGNRIRFWSGHWCGSSALSHSFSLSLYSIS